MLASTENSLKDQYFLWAVNVPKQNQTSRRVRFLIMSIQRCTFHLHSFQVYAHMQGPFAFPAHAHTPEESRSR